jgi:hypothetical protein
MWVYDDSGGPLDATVEISGGAEGMRIVFESRGGSKRGTVRNKDYIPALTLVLSRMARLDVRIIDAFLVSAKARRRLSEEDRRLHLLGYPFPVHMAEHLQAGGLARVFRRTAAALGRQPKARGSGNPTRRIEIRFEVLAFRGCSFNEIAGRLLNPALPRSE